MLLLWGNEDRVISVADAKRLRELPLAEVRIARGVGHSLPLEVAAWANEHIARFANSLTQIVAKAA
jgi:pimeloyl-ACP methyl ester carboxylesterase